MAGESEASSAPASPPHGGARGAVQPFQLDAGDPWFDGHFDGAPVLPGVAHLAFAVQASASVTGGRRLQGVRGVRFTRPLRPGDAGQVVITPGDDARSWRFEIVCDGQAASHGWLVYGDASPHVG